MVSPFRCMILQKKKLLLASIVVLGIVLIGGLIALFADNDVDPQTLFETSLQKTLQSSSYCYSIEVKQNGQELVSQVKGERIEPDRVHIKGQMLQSRNVEFTQLEDMTYMKDPWSGQWITLEGTNMAQAELFFMELNPMSLFELKDVTGVTALKKEKVDGSQTILLELRPTVNNRFFDYQYVDFHYLVWVDRKQEYIKKAIVETMLPGGQKGLVVEMKFWNFNAPLDIEKPDTKQ